MAKVENDGQLETISVVSDRFGVWSGMTVDQAKIEYSKLYAVGTLSTIHFGVKLEPFDAKGKLARAQSDLLDTYELVNADARDFANFSREQGWDIKDNETNFTPIPLIDNNFSLPWLCQSIDLSLLDAQTDSVQVGSFQLNHITGNNSGEISIPFIETRNAAILNSALAIKAIMFPDGEDGGTQAVPNDYLMRMTIFLFDRHSHSTRVFEVQHLVALQTGSIPLDATNRNGVGIVTLNFIKMFPMLK
ncbi:hypothetical protein F959_01682 [Acinetobacter venetianus RAG-1 = CIP 110063]|uniref:Uncharacterized protein n=1 Tax=Acinetobacter venetianus (strain ATCC 31012 / DSM 23050 / BCRC 14357 / CCUG 45561 / CIP 110063 / KCTC 2702 / LMG 19082 / RAG-1) TaxID=1191460 RepID=N8ZZB9_ACIVR|nr:hypothetical protein [Acinetobacter venetianus]ENV36875.1 hypothetical protein F959_01682 [Acinetobacter venetianus RAG-1 = CIP 110063]